ncbi:MAG: DUF4173 domain-containing protein [Bacteroidia bacterium]
MKLPSSIITLLSVLAFGLLFYKHQLGLNVAIYALITLLLFLSFKRSFFTSKLNLVVASGFGLSAISYSVYGSPFALAISIFSFFILFGLHSFTSFKNLLYAIPNTFATYFHAWEDFFNSSFENRFFKKQLKLGKWFRIAFIPLLVVALFVLLYSLGSSHFADWFGRVFGEFADWLLNITKYVNIQFVFILLLGLVFGVIHALNNRETWISKTESLIPDFIKRNRKKERSHFRNLDLKYEYKSAVFLFGLLNTLLAVLVFLEIKNEWLGFHWDGEFLKGSVHSGTYVLIFSILISIAITAYFYRRNLNFYPRAKTLHLLTKIWIVLNVLLVVAVAVRNYHYILYFALAYKRIGVYFFLILCVIGLLTLWFKISQKKSSFYLIRVNAIVAYVGLVSLCFFNWDGIIAKYNIAHHDRSFVHVEFLLKLSDKALPHLKLDSAQIQAIEEKQQEAIPFAERGYFNEHNYEHTIDRRITLFKHEFESNSWLDRTISDYWVYEKLP